MATHRVRDLTADDDFIRRAPVSERRKEQFLWEYQAERRRVRTLEGLFERAGSLRLEALPPPTSALSVGVNAIVFKASFVEGANWLLPAAQPFAVAREEALLRHFDDQLRQATSDYRGATVHRNRTTISDALSALASELQRRDYAADVFVITGPLGQELYDDLTGVDLAPTTPSPGTQMSLRNDYRLINTHDGIPILDIAESPTPSLYAVDLARFATLTRYSEDSDLTPEFAVRAFTDTTARDVLKRQPRLILDPPAESGMEDERVRQLQLRVGLELWETYRLDVHDREAVMARPLADVALD
jgi:hypothetical protein